MDKIKKLIFVLIILIIIIIIILLNILRGSTEDYDGNSDQNISNEESFDESDLKLNNSEFSIVTNNSEYYAIKKIIDDFYEYSNWKSISPF